MALFENCHVLLELKNLPFKEKKRLKLAVTENGGNISYVVNKQCSLVVTSDVSGLSSNRLRSIQKHQTPVVGVDYVYRCLERGALLPVDEYKLDISSSSPPSTFISLSLSPPKRNPLSQQVSKVPTSKPVADQSKDQRSVDSDSLTKKAGSQERSGNFLDKFRIYTENDSDLPAYPDNFQVAKYSIFEKVTSSTWFVLELQSFRGEKEQQYRVVSYRKDDIKAESAAVRDQLVFVSSSEDALEVYQALREQLKAAGLQPRKTLPPQAWDLGSAPLKQLLLEEKLNTGRLSQEVGVFVELLWTEALGCLDNILQVSISGLSFNDVSRAEGLLLQAQKKLRKSSHAEVASLLDEVYTLLPHREPRPPASAKLISQKLDLCQLIRDVLNVSEVTLRSPSPSCLGKYRALRCSIEAVPPDSLEFQAVTSLLQDRKVQIQQVLSVSRGAELQMFKNELDNVKPLLHSSAPSSFVGILSRGLLLPRVGVEHHGIERTDIGNLGSGIYFSDAMSTSLKYSKPGVTDGSRLLLVCDVALGRCKDLQKRDPSLTQAPEGYHSVHGVRRTPYTHSEFEDDEYVVYSPDQVKLRYVVQFSVDGDQLKEFSPSIDTTAELPQPASDQVLASEEDGVGSSKNPLDDVKGGLLDSSGQQLPLQAVHVKCKLMDLLSQVIIFQKYTNQSSVPIEAKYVFPLDDSAAVCGFEAFINGKHVVGQVKEKEKARKEYKQAIEKGHGAYLMDQDAPDVFTISVGNLPPNATVLIKVTFVSELIVRDGCVFFSLPGSVAPWQQSAALNQTTQVTVEKVCVTDQAASMGEFSLDMSIEMPYEMTSLQCITHNIKMKRTDCKAVVSVLPGQVMGPDGFQLSVTLSDIHLPRMWVEKHPDKDSQACMLVFYPDFDDTSSEASSEVVILLDTSESMTGESLQTARRIALQLLKTFVSSRPSVRLNVILFGTDHTEAFVAAQPLVEGIQQAKKFIMSSPPVGGSTELWRPLRALSLLPPSRGLRNLLLLSDGHIQNADLTLQLLRDNAQHSRLFTCGLSPTANRHMLRALAQAGGGAYEFFDTKTKHNWAEKAEFQVKRMASPGCSSVSVKWQQFNPTAPPPVQAPTQLHALFNNCHTLVYGFVPHCTQATLLGDLSGQEIKTMVSTSELQKTRGTFLHKLTARAIIRDYEDGSLDTNEAEHEGKKAELKSFIIELSKEFSILSQFTSFVAIEERDSEQTEEGFTDIPKLIAEEDVDLLPYMSWISPQDEGEDEEEELFSYPILDCESSYYLMAPDALCSLEIETEKMILLDATTEDICDSDLDEMSSSTISPSYLPTTPSYVPSYDEPMCDTLSPRAQTVCDSADSVYLSGKERFQPRERISPLTIRSRFVCFSPAPPPPPPPPPPPIGSLEHSLRMVPVALCAPSFPLPPPPKNQSASLPHPPPPPCPIGSSSAERSLPEAHLFRPASFVARPQRAEMQSASLTPHLHPKFSCWDEVPAKDKIYQSKRVVGSSIRRSVPEEEIMEQSSVSLAEDSAVPSYSLTTDAASLDIPYRLKAHSRSVQKSKHSRSLPQAQGAPFAASQFPLQNQGSLFGSASQSVSSDAFHMPPLKGSQLSSSSLGGPYPSSGGFSFGSTSVVKETPSPLVMPGASPQYNVLSGVPFGQEASRPRTTIRRRAMSFGLSELVLDEDLPSDKEVQFLGQRLRGPPKSVKRIKCSLSAKSIPVHQSVVTKSKDPEEMKLKWVKIFQMQHSEGYWECTAELGEFIKVDVDTFANVFLKNKGISSLGVRVHKDILRLVATLLVLQLMRAEKLEEGKLLRTLFCLDDSPQPRSERWKAVKRAVDWVCWADHEYPCAYSRLEFGWSWESSTRQLLGYERLPSGSPLSGFGTGTPLQVH